MTALLKACVVAMAIALFACLAIESRMRPHVEASYSAAESRVISKLAVAPINPNDEKLAYLFADDGQPVNQKIKLREWHRARQTLGKE